MKRIYTDPQYHFRITIPDSSWILSDSTGLRDVLVMARKIEKIQDFFPNVNVSIQKLEHMMTPEEYASSNDSLLTSQGFFVLSKRQKVINQIIFEEIHAESHQNYIPVSFLYYCMIKDRNSFIITCVAPLEYFNIFESDFKCIVSSFHFI